MPTINRKSSITKHRRAENVERKERQKVYNSALWKRLRTAKQMTSPLCEVCLLEGKVALAEDTHHLVSPFKYVGAERDAVAYAPTNLISLCKTCHNRIHHGDLKGCTSLDEIRQRIEAKRERDEPK